MMNRFLFLIFYLFIFFLSFYFAVAFSFSCSGFYIKATTPPGTQHGLVKKVGVLLLKLYLLVIRNVLSLCSFKRARRLVSSNSTASTEKSLSQSKRFNLSGGSAP